MKNTVLRIVEILVLGGILTAFILPLLVPSQETDTVSRLYQGKVNPKS